MGLCYIFCWLVYLRIPTFFNNFYFISFIVTVVSFWSPFNWGLFSLPVALPVSAINSGCKQHMMKEQHCFLVHVTVSQLFIHSFINSCFILVCKFSLGQQVWILFYSYYAEFVSLFSLDPFYIWHIKCNLVSQPLASQPDPYMRQFNHQNIVEAFFFHFALRLVHVHTLFYYPASLTCLCTGSTEGSQINSDQFLNDTCVADRFTKIEDISCINFS